MAGSVVDSLPGVDGVSSRGAAIHELVSAHSDPPGVHNLVVLEVARQRQPQHVSELQQQRQLPRWTGLSLHTMCALYDLDDLCIYAVRQMPSPSSVPYQWVAHEFKAVYEDVR